ncbi:Protein of unknown function [Gryllus bimaculatus]|nr:Protein of unknown function [Gryllus bimaculatus]
MDRSATLESNLLGVPQGPPPLPPRRPLTARQSAGYSRGVRFGTARHGTARHGTARRGALESEKAASFGKAACSRGPLRGFPRSVDGGGGGGGVERFLRGGVFGSRARGERERGQGAWRGRRGGGAGSRPLSREQRRATPGDALGAVVGRRSSPRCRGADSSKKKLKLSEWKKIEVFPVAIKGWNSVADNTSSGIRRLNLG